MSYSNELAHYGVKGMKWGVRRAEKKAAKEALDKPNANYSRGQRGYDRNNFGKGGAKRINRRLNQGQDIKTARKNEYKRRAKVNTARSTAILGAYYAPRVYRLAKVVGPMAMGVLAQNVAARAETNRGRATNANSMGLPFKPTNGPTYTKKNRKGVYNISSL